MTKKIKMLYNTAIQDLEFCNLFLKADTDKELPHDHNDKVYFAAIYYGYMLNKYGIYWQIHLKD